MNKKHQLELERRRDRVGTEYYSVYYDLLVTIGSASHGFSAMWNNTEIAVKNITFDLA